MTRRQRKIRRRKKTRWRRRTVKNPVYTV